MIAHLTGRPISQTLDTVVLDVHGVGFLVHVPMGALGRVRADEHGRVSLWVHTSVREDAIQLFGFAVGEEREMFHKLIAISGVGPKLALAILSELSPSEVITAVHTNSVAEFCRVSGIGKKTAQRLIIELKTSLDETVLQAISPPRALRTGPLEDLRSALLNLGFPSNTVDLTVERLAPQAEEGMGVEAMVREALKMLRS